MNSSQKNISYKKYNSQTRQKNLILLLTELVKISESMYIYAFNNAKNFIINNKNKIKNNYEVYIAIIELELYKNHLLHTHQILDYAKSKNNYSFYI